MVDTPTEAVGIAFADPTAPEDAAWYRIGGDPKQFPPHIEIGTMSGGVTFDVEMRWDPSTAPGAILPLRPVLGVGGGVAVTVDDDGQHSSMQAVVAASGDVHDLLTSTDVILDGVLSPDGRQVYYVTADRLTGDLTGAWRYSVADGAPPQAIEALVGAAADMRLAAVAPFLTRMLLSPDGSTVGLFRCVDLVCFLRTVRADDGLLLGEQPIERGWGDPFAITDEGVLLSPTVPDGPARIGEIIDLGSGQRVRLPIEPWPSGRVEAVAGVDGPVLVFQTAGLSVPPEAVGAQGGPAPQVFVISMSEFQVLAHHEPPLSALGVLSTDDYSVGVDLPPGWILIQGSQPGEPVMGAYALNVRDGSLVPLPPVGEFGMQG